MGPLPSLMSGKSKCHYAVRKEKEKCKYRPTARIVSAILDEELGSKYSVQDDGEES